MEHKTTTAFNTKLDADQGIVETVFAVFGNLDKGLDIIHNGAFAKTFAERGRKVKVLDQHRTTSVRDVIGKPLALRELSKAELPGGLLAEHPDATGGAWAQVQFLMDTPEGEGAFKRIKAGAIGEWSFGYDALDSDHSTTTKDGEDITVRNLRSVKLYELSPVLWGMNPATTTLSAKAGDEPSEGKPWAAFQDGDKWNVYKLDADGNRTGESLGEHDSEGEAQAQVRALYASEDDGKAGDVPMMPNLDSLIHEGVKAALAEMGYGIHELKGDEAPVEDDAPQAADDTTQETDNEQAGPDAEQEDSAPPTSNDELRRQIDQALVDLAILELEQPEV